MYIHKLRKSTAGNAGRLTSASKGKTMVGTGNTVARNHKRITGSELKPEIFDISIGNGIKKNTDTLRSLKISKPRVPKKYITFE